MFFGSELLAQTVLPNSVALAPKTVLIEYRPVDLGAQNLTDFYQENLDLELVEAESVIQTMEEFVREQNAHLAAAEPISYPNRESLENVQNVLDHAAQWIKSDDLRELGLRSRLETLKKADSRLRAALAADTLIQPDVYTGSDAADLKSFSEQVVARTQPGLYLRKTVLISPDWKEENFLEWADAAQTVLRCRTPRRLTAQVAGRVNAETRLYTLYLVQERLSSGGWGQSEGQVIFTDPMLEENVK